MAKHREEWRRLELATKNGPGGLSKLEGEEIQDLIRLYQRTSTHLAEVQSRYREPRLVSYLTSVVAGAHAAIYSARSRSARAAWQLFTVRYREAIRRTAPFILVAGSVLFATILFTLTWVMSSQEAAAGVVPIQARQAAQKLGAKRPDFGISPASVSSLIFLNNARVAFLSFALGISAGVGTLWVLVQNGFLIGAMGGGFHIAANGGRFWALVLPHGLLELTAISIAAGAGLRVGWSLISPGDRFRSRALAEDARDAVVVVAGVIPAFLVAALIEGFVTGTAVPSWIQLTLGAVVAIAYVGWLFGLMSRDRQAGSSQSAEGLYP